MKDLRFVSPHIRGKNPLRVPIHPRKKGIKPIKIAIRKIAHRIQERKVRLAKTFRGHTADLIRHFRRPPPLYDIAIIHQIFRLSITSCAICVSFSGNVCYTECVENQDGLQILSETLLFYEASYFKRQKSRLFQRMTFRFTAAVRREALFFYRREKERTEQRGGNCKALPTRMRKKRSSKAPSVRQILASSNFQLLCFSPV